MFHIWKSHVPWGVVDVCASRLCGGLCQIVIVSHVHATQNSAPKSWQVHSGESPNFTVHREAASQKFMQRQTVSDCNSVLIFCHTVHIHIRNAALMRPFTGESGTNNFEGTLSHSPPLDEDTPAQPKTQTVESWNSGYSHMSCGVPHGTQVTRLVTLLYVIPSNWAD